MTVNWDPGIQDIQAEVFGGQVSILKQGSLRKDEIIRAVLTGIRKGMGWGIFVGIIYGALLPYFGRPADNRLEVFFQIVLLGMILGCITVTFFYWLESIKGELRIDDETLSYWTWYGRTKIPMGKIFGAAPNQINDNKYFQMCFLADNYRGYNTRRWNFRFYGPESGPVMKVSNPNLDGSQLAREAIILHLKNRTNTGRSVANIPDYRYQSLCYKTFRTLTADFKVKAEFRCDGETIYVRRDTECKMADSRISAQDLRDPDHHLVGYDYEVPVRDVVAVECFKGREVGLSSASTLWLKLKPGSSTDAVRIEAGFFTHYKQMEHYAWCLPTLFPVIESFDDHSNSSYWKK